jgi:Leucine-rich repeat (LRR) protein
MNTLSPTERRNREALRRMADCKMIRASTLDLSGIGIEQIPEELTAFTWLTRLDLSHNRLTEVPEFIGNFAGLTWLDISYNRYPDTGEFFWKSIKILPESIVNIKSLQNLWIEALKEIPLFIGNMRNLKRLSLYTPHITSFPDSIGNIDKLVFLDIRCENMGEVPSCINRLISLEYLELWDMNIDKLPEFLADLPKLKDIDYSGSVVKEIPKRLEQFIHPWNW